MNYQVTLGPNNEVVLAVWDRWHEVEVDLTVEEARELANKVMDMAADAGANRALTSDDVV